VIFTLLVNVATNITNTSAMLHGYLNDAGGENCTVWFEYGYGYEEEECAGAIITGEYAKDNRSILWKNRHNSGSNQLVVYKEGTNYSFISFDDHIRPDVHGMNEAGLAIASFMAGER